MSSDADPGRLEPLPERGRGGEGMAARALAARRGPCRGRGRSRPGCARPRRRPGRRRARSGPSGRRRSRTSGRARSRDSASGEMIGEWVAVMARVCPMTPPAGLGAVSERGGPVHRPRYPHADLAREEGRHEQLDGRDRGSDPRDDAGRRRPLGSGRRHGRRQHHHRRACDRLPGRHDRHDRHLLRRMAVRERLLRGHHVVHPRRGHRQPGPPRDHRRAVDHRRASPSCGRRSSRSRSSSSSSASSGWSRGS